jgi:Flp pilus assembly protein TadG
MKLRGFRRDRSGSAAIEFAVIAPVLAIVVLGIVDVWSLASSNINANVAVKAASNYYLQGGTDDITAQALGTAAWRNPPDDANLSIARACKCSGVTVTCSSSCATGNSTPVTIVTIAASGTWTAPFAPAPIPSEEALAAGAVVRVR